MIWYCKGFFKCDKEILIKGMKIEIDLLSIFMTGIGKSLLKTVALM